jgi:hypothetical protein
MKKNKNKNLILVLTTLLIAVSILAFKNQNNISSSNPLLTVPAVYNKIYGATSITNDGTFITISTNGVPDHVSPYYPTSNALYQAYTGTTFGGNTFAQNPNTIATQTFTFKIPLNPTVATNHAATPLGAIGVALNGVAFYNQYAGPNNLVLTTEIASFDKYYGHPTATSQYHYHVEPLYLTTVISTKSGLMGFMLDGFPIYGPQEIINCCSSATTTLVSSSLDAYHGHTSVTADYPNGIYHYHFTADAPYLNGNGYYGTAGTVTQ